MRAIIDIGSNSVRLMMPDGKKTVITTALGEGLAHTGMLQGEPINRTILAIMQLAELARAEGCEVEAFATEAVRSAKNGAEFAAMLSALGVPVRVLTGREEALSGYLGATGGRGGVLIDVGGASTEIISGKGEEIKFSVSLPIGIVRARDMFGEDYEALTAYVNELMENAKVQVFAEEVIGIGGTAISVAAVDSGEAYDVKNTHGRRITREGLIAIRSRLIAMTRAERLTVPGLASSRVDTVCGGLTIILAVIERLGATCMVASESDNMEGYLAMTEAERTTR